ncbi:maleylacetate reductase [Rhizobium sp. LjRoot258]|jgi:alcohol dehydrogenase class IV|uniref:maleylacetate reductase n=1 Tax=Rhizobium sp. LjRoot258 TaxID=3342299 RepID=UPI003ECC4105
MRTLETFTYNGQPSRVIFGSGTASLIVQEIERLGSSRVLVLSTAPQEQEARKLAAGIGEKVAGVFPGAVMHTPVAVTEQAVGLAMSLEADCLVALGGGSTTGLSKAIALRTNINQIIVPTTYAGSEMTPILGETKGGEKVTQSNPRILPEVVIYDVDLTMTLPVGMSGTSGINAIAHAVEALYAKERNPIVSMMAIEGIEALYGALPLIAENPSCRDARSNALYGAWLSGICLGSVGMALHHKLCHILGGTFGLPHAETHAIILPHALAYNAPSVPDAMAKLRKALRTDDPPIAFFELLNRVAAPRALSDIGMSASDIEIAVEEVFERPYWNPRPLQKSAIRDLLGRAHAGARPAI